MGQSSTWHEEKSRHLGRSEGELHLILELLAVDPSKVLFTEVFRPIIVISSFSPIIRLCCLYSPLHLSYFTYCIFFLIGVRWL